MIAPDQFNPVAGGPFIDLAAQMNTLRRFAISIRPVAGKNTRVQETSHGSMIDASPRSVAGAGGTAGFKLFKVVSVRGDFLVCRAAAFGAATTPGRHYTEASPSTVLVAKPYRLRQSPYDGLTVDGISYSYITASERGATRSAITETQVIVPAYKVEGAGVTGALNTDFDVIWAADVSVAEHRDKIYGYFGDSPHLVGFAEVGWQDINADGRAWAVKSSTIP